MTFVGPKHPMFNIIKAVNKAANVVTGDTPEIRHLLEFDFYDWCNEYDRKGRAVVRATNCTQSNPEEICCNLLPPLGL